MADNNDVVILQLDRPRVLRLGHKALKRFSALTGARMSDLDSEIDHYDKLTALLWCMISVDDETVTPDELDTWLDRQPSLKPVMNAVTRAIELSFHDPDAEPSEGPTKPTGTGIEA